MNALSHAVTQWQFWAGAVVGLAIYWLIVKPLVIDRLESWLERKLK